MHPHHVHGRTGDHDQGDDVIAIYFNLHDYGNIDVSSHVDFHADHLLVGDQRRDALAGILAAGGAELGAAGRDVQHVEPEQRRSELDRLRDACRRYANEQRFKPGDNVTWSHFLTAIHRD